MMCRYVEYRRLVFSYCDKNAFRLSVTGSEDGKAENASVIVEENHDACSFQMGKERWA